MAAFAIDRERNAGDGLHQEAVDHGAEDVVVVEIRHQFGVQIGFGGREAINRALHQIGDAQAVAAHVKPEQVGVEYLRRVIQAAGLARVKELVAAALVFDVDPAFLDVDVRRAVFAHGAELDDVALRRELHHCPDDVEGRIEIVSER